MSQSDVVLLERTKGQYPLSIATSLAIESLMNVHPEIKHDVEPYGQMSRIWINMRTLHRNILGACPNDLVSQIEPRAVADVLMEEVDQLREIFQNGGRPVDVQFYYCNYRDIEKQYPYAQIRYDRTEKQKAHTTALIAAMEKFIEKVKPYQNKDNPLVRLFEKGIISHYPEKAHTVFLTHLPIDLVNASDFGEAHLIESHTGAYKPRAQWYSKFYDGKELPMIPFNAVFLQIFGDKEMFSPLDKKARLSVIDMAKKYNWTPTSTSALLRYGINQILDEYLKQILLTMFGKETWKFN